MTNICGSPVVGPGEVLAAEAQVAYNHRNLDLIKLIFLKFKCASSNDIEQAGRECDIKRCQMSWAVIFYL